ncbi:MAG: queuosine precursor transporter [Deltaproteobacteria bacterium]|jgi:uncharacterized integral membrane protein (TIGR00697 family)|nr:queuosine precursor transporter [Deltaproteobacteria bacterium]
MLDHQAQAKKNNSPNPQPHEDRYLAQITGLFTGLLIISNICSNRLVVVGPLEFDAGTLMFPLTYIFGDLLTEVYGFQKARRVIWTGFLALFISAICLYLASLFPAPPGYETAQAWDQAMSLTPRIVLGSLVAYLFGEMANAITLAKIKYKRLGGQGFRFIASTVVGQTLDTIIFASIAFLGVLDQRLWLTLVFSNIIYKVALEIVLLPITLFCVGRLKKIEGTIEDRGLLENPSLNPFKKSTPVIDDGPDF